MPTKQQEPYKEILDLAERFERGIEATDHQMDKVVYKLYRLAEEEIRII